MTSDVQYFSSVADDLEKTAEEWSNSKSSAKREAAEVLLAKAAEYRSEADRIQREGKS